MRTGNQYNEYSKEYCQQIRKIEDNIDNYYKDIEDLKLACKNDEWIDYFLKNKNINSLSRELIDNLIDNIYVYEGKKIKIKYKYEDEYKHLLNFIKRRKKLLVQREFTLSFFVYVCGIIHIDVI